LDGPADASYVADLAVRGSHHRKGIGTELIQKTRDKMGPLNTPNLIVLRT